MLHKWLKDSVDQFPTVTFRYRFENKTNTHYISVSPESSITDAYCERENAIYELLSSTFPNENFIFGTEDKNFKMKGEFQTITGSLALINNNTKYELFNKVRDNIYITKRPIKIDSLTTNKGPRFTMTDFGMQRKQLLAIE